MEKLDVFRDYIQKIDVLIVDKNPSSRSRLLKIMYDLGCKRNRIHTAGEMAEAEQLIFSKNIGIVLSDYFIGGGSGFDLFKVVREKFPDKKELSLILVTSNISQTAVAKAAEEDVDSFIIKPYTVQSIQENLVSTIANKVKPTPYILKIEEAKELLFKGKVDESVAILNEAKKLHQKPALALFYLGQAEYMKDAVEQAKSSYSSGLSFNNIHYKCLLGLYEMFLEQKKFSEAYQVVKKIAKFFPANPDRLAQIVRLAVQTENYDDMQMYYEIFTSLDERTEQMVNYIGAGLFVSGKHKLINKKIDEAVRLFDNIAVSCSEFSKFTRAMITTLADFGHVLTAEKYLSRFPPGSDDQEDYLVSEYVIMSKKGEQRSAMAKHGLDIYNKNIRDPQCMKVMIEAMESCDYKKETIEKFKSEFSELWPHEELIQAA
jgi:CheY-like chemotaxis protein